MSRKPKREWFSVISVPLKGPPYVYVTMGKISTAELIAKTYFGPNAYVQRRSEVPPEILNQPRPFL